MNKRPTRAKTNFFKVARFVPPVNMAYYIQNTASKTVSVTEGTHKQLMKRTVQNPNEVYTRVHTRHITEAAL